MYEIARMEDGLDDWLLWNNCSEEIEEIILTDDSGRVVERLMVGGYDYEC